MIKRIVYGLLISMFTTHVAAQGWDDIAFADPSNGAEDVVTETGRANEPAGQQVDSSNTYILTKQYDPTPRFPGSSETTIREGGYIDIREFATEARVLQHAADTRDKIDVAYEGTALSSALVTTLPKTGDRFSLNVNLAEFEGEVGGGLTIGYAPSGRVMFHFGHARGSKSHLTRAGMSMSF